MKIKVKVATMFQRAIRRAMSEESDTVTFIKLTPQDLPSGDILLVFPSAEVKWHPETHYRNNDNVPVRKIVPAETLVTEAVVTHGGETVTFVQDAVIEIGI